MWSTLTTPGSLGFTVRQSCRHGGGFDVEMARSKIFQARTTHNLQHPAQNRPWTEDIYSFSNWLARQLADLSIFASWGKISFMALSPSEEKYLLRLFYLLWNMIGWSGHVMWQANILCYMLSRVTDCARRILQRITKSCLITNNIDKILPYLCNIFFITQFNLTMDPIPIVLLKLIYAKFEI